MICHVAGGIPAGATNDWGIASRSKPLTDPDDFFLFGYESDKIVADKGYKAKGFIYEAGQSYRPYVIYGGEQLEALRASVEHVFLHLKKNGQYWLDLS